MKKEKNNQVWIYGIHSVSALLERRPGEVSELLAAPAPGGARSVILEKARELGIKTRELPAREIVELTGSDAHQGVAAHAELPGCVDLSEIVDRPPHVILVLDGITDPHNLGAIARSAEALGASGIIVGKDRSAGLSVTAHKASSGALEWIPLCRVVNISRVVRELKEAGYWAYGADPDGDLCLESVDFTEKVMLVIGSEGPGLRPGVKKELDFLVKITLKGCIKSLNASVASAILVYKILERRG